MTRYRFYVVRAYRVDAGDIYHEERENGGHRILNETDTTIDRLTSAPTLGTSCPMSETLSSRPVCF